MTSGVYNTTANILMVTAVGSAFLFDSGKFPRMAALSLGIISALLAIGLYFLNQRNGASSKEEDHQQPAAKGIEKIGTSFASPRIIGSLLANSEIAPFAGPVFTSVDKDLALYMQKAAARKFLRDYAVNHARSLQWQVVKGTSMALMKPEVELSPNEVAACAYEIIRNFSLSGDSLDWDYSFGPNGLHVSVRKSRSTVSVVPQEDFDFDPILAYLVE